MIKLTAQAFPAFEAAVLALAAGHFPEEPHGYGATPAFITPEEWLALDGVDEGVEGENYEFVPPPPPGQVPNTAAQQAIWTQANKLHLSYRAALQVVKNYIITNIDPLQIKVLDVNNQGWRLSAPQMMELLRTRFGRLSATDIDTARATLDVPYTSEKDMRIFIAEHRETHILLASNGFAVNEYDKFQALYLAISRSGAFPHVLSTFFTLHPTLVDQTFGSLSEVLITASDNLRSSTVRMHALVALSSEKKDTTARYHGPQPADPNQRVVIQTQFLCPRHGWCNSLHTCTEAAPKKKS
jgi:hypothetical protein